MKNTYELYRDKKLIKSSDDPVTLIMKHTEEDGHYRLVHKKGEFESQFIVKNGNFKNLKIN